MKMNGQHPATEKSTGISIRRLDPSDIDAVVELAQLDSKTVPEGELLGIETEGRLLAVAALEGGETLANPFARTTDLRALLELRAAQLRRREQPRRMRFLSPRRERSGSLAGSPPGAGGRLLTLPVRPS